MMMMITIIILIIYNVLNDYYLQALTLPLYHLIYSSQQPYKPDITLSPLLVRKWRLRAFNHSLLMFLTKVVLSEKGNLLEYTVLPSPEEAVQ